MNSVFRSPEANFFHATGRSLRSAVVVHSPTAESPPLRDFERAISRRRRFLFPAASTFTRSPGPRLYRHGTGNWLASISPLLNARADNKHDGDVSVGASLGFAVPAPTRFFRTTKKKTRSNDERPRRWTPEALFDLAASLIGLGIPRKCLIRPQRPRCSPLL